MTTTPCLFMIFILLGIIIVPLLYLILRPLITRLNSWVRSIEILMPRIPRFGWYFIKYSIPAFCIVLFISNLHFVDCHTHKPLAHVKDCHCEMIASK